MTWVPLRGRVIVTRIVQVTSDCIIIPDTYTDMRSARTADRGVVLAAGRPPAKECMTPCGLAFWAPTCEPLKPGDEVLYLGPAEKLAIEWQGRTAYAVTYEEVLGVVER